MYEALRNCCCGGGVEWEAMAAELDDKIEADDKHQEMQAGRPATKVFNPSYASTLRHHTLVAEGHIH